MVSKKKGGLLKKPKTITGSTHKSITLKPQKARQLIRRFHVLQKNKASIIRRLNLTNDFDVEKLTEQNYLSVLKSQHKRLLELYQRGRDSVTAIDSELLKIDDSLSVRDLIHKLGEIDGEISKRGGLEAYQSASTQGQNGKRGGDSSKKLLEWLSHEKYKSKVEGQRTSLTALEIGCLSAQNLISTSGLFKEVVKIDLKSNHPSILEQNFMERPLPENETGKFNVVSCSLVLNFVTSAEERGRMLERITRFLSPLSGKNQISSLFFVLPLPCVSNSRYFDNDVLDSMMQSLGFEVSFYYEAKKVAYWMFDWKGDACMKKKRFAKKELHKGSKRNNFCIVLK